MFQIDGFSGINNIFIVGTTNRLDLIDSALLRYFFLSLSLLSLSLSLCCTYSPLCSNHRPGRLELLLEVGAPDEAGRLEILKVHTQNLAKTSLLESDVNLEEIGKVATLLYS